MVLNLENKMINHKLKFIYIQIPKTGCTSIQEHLKAHADGSLVINCKKDILSKNRRAEYKHATYKELAHILGADIDNYFKFTFVRNPYDWLVSNFLYCRGWHGCYISSWANPSSQFYKDRLIHLNLASNKTRVTSFKEWLKIFTKGVMATQLELITNNEGDITVDFIGKLENITKDSSKIFNILNLNKFEVRHLNKTANKNKEYQSYYDDESRSLVEKYHERELNLFNYHFEL